MTATFAPSELNAFLAKLVSTEAIADPLTRCLAYPDPPGSHWSHTAVAAYCRYHNLPVVGMAEVRRLIESGHAAELDRRMLDALRLQNGSEDSRGLLDETFQLDFSSGSSDLRRTLDAWKKQSPRSAFAYAASGYAYEHAAHAARGSKWSSQTSKSQFAAMHDQLVLARADLGYAVELDPRITPIYKAMLMVAQLESDDDYAQAAVRRGLQIDPANYSIYVHWMQMVQPKWGGSLVQMRQIAAQAAKYAKRNPLLALLEPEPELQAAGLCNCSARTPDVSAFRSILDKPVAATSLIDAADAAARANLSPQAAVYRAEALRFAPDARQQLDWLIMRLFKMQDVPALQHQVGRALAVLTNRMVRIAPNDPRSWQLHGSTYDLTVDPSRAEADYVHAASLAPDDDSAQGELLRLYMLENSWDKAWEVSSRLIKIHPEDPYGWIARARVQYWQARPGIRETAQYIVEHFRDDKAAQEYVNEAQIYLTSEPMNRQPAPPSGKGKDEANPTPVTVEPKSPTPEGDE